MNWRKRFAITTTTPVVGEIYKKGCQEHFFSLDRSGEGFSTSQPLVLWKGLGFAFCLRAVHQVLPCSISVASSLVATTAIDFETGKRGGCMVATHRSI
jgi:hypothetical protein